MEAPDATKGINAGGSNHHVAFRVKDEQDEPWLTSALQMINEVVYETIEQGITEENIYFQFVF